MAPEIFEKCRAAEDRYNARCRAAGSFLDVPKLQHGQAQVPILYSRETLDAVNKEVADALNELNSAVPEDVWSEYYIAKSLRAKKDQESGSDQG